MREEAELVRLVHEHERRELSRELHDGVANGLALISMEIAAVEESDDPLALRQALAVVQSAARESSSELRTMVAMLREPSSTVSSEHTPSGLLLDDGVSIATATRGMTDVLIDRGFSLSTSLGNLEDLTVDALHRSVLHTYVRIIQEAVTNIVKHAPSGANCEISTAATQSELRIRVANGIHTNDAERAAKMTAGVGLKGIEERATLVTGSVIYGRVDDRWVVEAALPLTLVATPSDQRKGI